MRLTTLSFALALTACGNSAQYACGVGDTRACVGPGQCSGAQVCLSDRSGFGSCDCGGRAGGGGSSGVGGGSSAGGSGGASGGTAGGAAPTPALELELSVDREVIATELGKPETFTVTALASNGFSGRVDLLGALTGANDAGFAGWSFTLSDAGLDVPLDGLVTAEATVTVGTDAVDLAANAEVRIAGRDGGTSTRLTALRQYTVDINTEENDAGLTGCVYGPPSRTKVRRGTLLRFRNVGAVPIVIHISSSTTGCMHQPTGGPGTMPGAAYECTPTNAGVLDYSCHTPGADRPNTYLIEVE
ncbi:MAG: hypothetical protein IPJ65_24555 [Archangiaceae bacterium]|nr:hypothetical protein [Archangiaceae bacterium]